ncbi:hypothetical protein, partial [Proteiniphilum sp. X52]|uniref:hypothetical protein n=1 Tax=Proteiniphilum sp. X52 TaxID=2382159 RepID=UPI002101C237
HGPPSEHRQAAQRRRAHRPRLPAQGAEGGSCQPGLGDGHHLCPVGGLPHVPGCHHGRLQPSYRGMVAFQHDDHPLVPGVP